MTCNLFYFFFSFYLAFLFSFSLFFLFPMPLPTCLHCHWHVNLMVHPKRFIVDTIEMIWVEFFSEKDIPLPVSSDQRYILIVYTSFFGSVLLSKTLLPWQVTISAPIGWRVVRIIFSYSNTYFCCFIRVYIYSLKISHMFYFK